MRVPTSGEYLPQLDGLRALAITLVLLSHCVVPPDEGLVAWATRHTISNGKLGVDLFFALSGYLITRILLGEKARPRYFSRFYARRALRIFPPYFALLAAMFVLVPVLPFGPLGSRWPFVTYTTNLWWILHRFGLVTGRAPYEPLAHTWSLAIEEQFYVAFPVVVYVLDRRHLRWLLWAVVGLSPVARLATNAMVGPGLSYWLTFCRLDVLAMGALVAVTLDEKASVSSSWLRRAQLLLLVFTAATVGLWGMRQINFEKPFFNGVGLTIVDGAAALLVVVAVLRGSAAIDAWLRWKPAVALGRISYGVYLFHYPVFLLTRDMVGISTVDGWRETILLATTSIGSTLVIAALSWRWFERPILGLKNAVMPGRETVGASAAGETPHPS